MLFESKTILRHGNPPVAEISTCKLVAYRVALLTIVIVME